MRVAAVICCRPGPANYSCRLATGSWPLKCIRSPPAENLGKGTFHSKKPIDTHTYTHTLLSQTTWKLEIACIHVAFCSTFSTYVCFLFPRLDLHISSQAESHTEAPAVVLPTCVRPSQKATGQHPHHFRPDFITTAFFLLFLCIASHYKTPSFLLCYPTTMSAEGAMANQYNVLEELGSGSFGTVYKAIDRITGEVVAIKHVRDVTDLPLIYQTNIL